MGSTRAIWEVQDKIALDADEENAIKLKREIVSGRERVVRTADLPTAVQEVEAARIKAAIRPWDSYGVNVDRGWLEPLLSVLAGRET